MSAGGSCFLNMRKVHTFLKVEILKTMKIFNDTYEEKCYTVTQSQFIAVKCQRDDERQGCQ